MTSRKLIFENSKSKISLVDSASYGSILGKVDVPEKIIMKVLKHELPQPEEIKRFYNEYDILKDISHSNIRKVYLKTKYQNRHTIFFEWIDGKVIRELGKITSVNRFLTLATQMASSLMEVHARGIIHKDINANNILVTSTDEEIKLIDFGIASRATQTVNLAFEGTPFYSSPEQMSRVVVDHRSDLYSLGVVFYFMLAGRNPFQDDCCVKNLEQTHLRDSTVVPVSEIDPAIPLPLSALVNKLMKKKPQDRYQTACGLLHDLKTMLSQVQNDGGKGNIDPDFMIGRKDFSGRLQTSHKIYSREEDIGRLLSAFDRITENGTFEVILVAGAAGTGKSTLLKEVHEAIVNEKAGYFVNGKFDRLQKDEPYSAILRSFNAFCDFVMTNESNESIEQLKMLIRDALGVDGKILTCVMPKLRCLIGDLPNVPDVEPIEIKNRLNNVFLKFINAITCKKRPILFFIDDLQWADPESLGLLSVLAVSKDIKYVLFVGAYRHNEIDNASHHLISILNDTKNNKTTQTIEIGNLSKEDTAKLVIDLLNHPAHVEVSLLADLVYLKTHGNAFFVVQFLRSLESGGLLYFCYDEFIWKWNMDKITKESVTENVVQLLVRSMIHFSDEMKHVLKMASCVGSHFRLSTLTLIIEDKYLVRSIEEAIVQGIIVEDSVENELFHFSHDRIHQAVYSLILESERNSVHLRIGQILKKKIDEKELDEMIFVIVNQLNSGLDMIDDKDERIEVAYLNLRAAKKARFSSAYKKAAMYVEYGIDLLGEDHWMKQYDLSLELYTVVIEAEYCNGEFDHMAIFMEELFTNARTILDAADSFLVKIRYLIGQKKFDDAVEVGLHVLSELGETLSTNASMISTMYNMLKTKMMLWGRGSSDAIVSMPGIENKTERVKMKILGIGFPPIIISNESLIVQVILRMVQISLSHGVSEFSAVAFARYGSLVANGSLVTNQHDIINEGYRFGQLALKLLNRFPNKKCLINTYPVVFIGINHRKQYIHDIIPHLRQSIQIAQDIGDFGRGLFTFYISCNYSFLSGKSLKEVDRDFSICYEKANTHKQQHVIDGVKPIWQVVGNLMESKSLTKVGLFSDIFTEGDIRAHSKGYLTCAYHLANIMHAYIFYDYDKAAQIVDDGSDKFPKITWYVKTTITFYNGLIALLKAREEQNNNKWIKIATNSIHKIEVLTKHCPDNHQHKLQLLLAERAVLEECDGKAIEHFDEAISYAERKGFMNIEALASERAFIFCIERCDLNSARVYYLRACQVYREWGANAKVSQIEELYGSQMSAFNKVAFKRKLKG